MTWLDKIETRALVKLKELNVEIKRDIDYDFVMVDNALGVTFYSNRKKLFCYNLLLNEFYDYRKEPAKDGSYKQNG